MQNIEQTTQRLLKKDRQSITGRAARWQELMSMIGEDFVVGTYPDFQSYRRNDNEVLDALEQYAQEWWRQGLLCFIDKLHLPCITCVAFSLEASLKYRLILKNPRVGAKYDLKKCIGVCQNIKCQILPLNRNDLINVAAENVLGSRDDIVHANIALDRPGNIIYSEGEDHEFTGDSSDIQFVEEFKNLARQTILDTKKVIDYLAVNA